MIEAAASLVLKINEFSLRYMTLNSKGKYRREREGLMEKYESQNIAVIQTSGNLLRRLFKRTKFISKGGNFNGKRDIDRKKTVTLTH
jgi:hypothetical protein